MADFSIVSSRYCIVIPHYRHVPQLSRFLPALAGSGLPLLVIDDGSGTDELEALKKALKPYSFAELVTRTENGGKGAATVTGLQAAEERNYSHVILVDADGQHDPADIIKLHRQSQTNPDALYSGSPQFGADIPPARLYGREITNVLARIEAGNFALKDAMCGLRVYPVTATLGLAAACGSRLRMEMDTELLVRACWQLLEVRYVDTKVVYPDEGASHFRLGKDNIRMTAMHIRLLLEALVRVPYAKFRKQKARDPIA